MASKSHWTKKFIKLLLYIPPAFAILLVLSIGILSAQELELIVLKPVQDITFDELTPEEIAQGKYFELLDEQGRQLTVTGRRWSVNDEFIAQDNRHYKVFKVEGYKAYGRYQGKVQLTPPANLSRTLSENFEEAAGGINPYGTEFVQEDEGGELKKAIAIYHTHNAESYVPTDGTDSIDGEGGIHEVGRAFQQALEEKGIKALFSEDLHTPHDRGAYRRSRDTVLELLEQEPDAIFDVHRDAAPPEAYATKLDSVPATQILFVVGRQNAHMQVNKEFAMDLKSISDQIHPGLVKGIMLAQGNYNQDLTPLSLLLEVGAHTNTRESAENGIAYFADSVGHYFYGTEGEVEGEETPPGGTAAQIPPEGGREIWRGIIRIVSLAVIAGLLFFLMNVGTWDNFKEKYGPRFELHRKEFSWAYERRRDILDHTIENFRNEVKSIAEKIRRKVR
ncbi:stage II sporulation protein P [Candidatus Contubernalis alkaliaceticus]|uniref:stage II sporulation protein P n=1 Tax=Candidatus Contubernalis alkaliaceticus TaxID=338645 RepID=UPI001F4C1D3D|nr:stage II sporulation protein P [Candidatus Contubernalis alkalaceticus]UNC91438.1 stage II sporulation protein P [Candidatus Contubernalis alkalaceticus]